jgi:phosphate transport system substrate-binding protein
MWRSFGFRRTALLATTRLSAALAALIISCPSRAQPVTLRSSDGSVTVSGPLIRFDGNAYTIRSGATAEMSLAASNFSCISDSCPDPSAFGIHGSNTIGSELMPRLIEAYAKSIGAGIKISDGTSEDEAEIKVSAGNGKTLANVDLQAHGSGTATPGFVSGKALIGMASRALNADELKQLNQQGFGDMRSPGNEHVVGLDGIVVIVSPGNPVAKLSLQQLQGIFSGAISDWPQVGGKPGKINVYARDSKSGTFDTFRTLVLEPVKQQLTDGAKRLESSNELSDLVANDPRGIGFIGFAYQRDAKAVSLVNECGMSFAPSTFDVKTEEYPLSRRLFLYTGKLPAGSFAAGLLDYAMSHYAQDVVRDAGFIDQELEVESTPQASRMADAQSPAKLKDSNKDPSAALARDLQETSRISATMRFRYNSAELDNKALNDVDTLATFLQFMRENKSERKLLLVGFSDAAGTIGKNMALSFGRAKAVRRALVGKLRDSHYARLIEVRGYGPALPVACNESDAGRDKNRRVEVWLTSAAPSADR